MENNNVEKNDKHDLQVFTNNSNDNGSQNSTTGINNIRVKFDTIKPSKKIRC